MRRPFGNKLAPAGAGESGAPRANCSGGGSTNSLTGVSFSMATSDRPLRDLALEEVADQWHHFVSLVLQREMAGVDEVKLDLRQIALVGMRAVGWEYLVVLSPDDQRRGLVFAEVSLDLRIER